MYSNVLIYKELLAWQKTPDYAQLAMKQSVKIITHLIISSKQTYIWLELLGTIQSTTFGREKLLKEKVDCRLWYIELLKLESDFFKLVERTGDVITAPGNLKFPLICLRFRKYQRENKPINK